MCMYKTALSLIEKSTFSGAAVQEIEQWRKVSRRVWPWVGLYTENNGSGPSNACRMVPVCFGLGWQQSSKDLLTTDIGAMGLRSFNPVREDLEIRILAEAGRDFLFCSYDLSEDLRKDFPTGQ